MAESGESGYSGGLEPVTNCDLLVIETRISFPREDVVALLKEGDALKVALQLSGGTPVVVVMHKGQVAGEVTSQKVQRLPEYIIRGTDYVATVISKNNGQLRVRIRAIE
jgi:hypothetical protein